MMIRNNDELKLFEETIERCQSSVMVLTPRGEQYDLKDPLQCYPGIAEMLKKDETEEPELFACCREDEMQLLSYLKRLENKAA